MKLNSNAMDKFYHFKNKIYYGLSSSFSRTMPQLSSELMKKLDLLISFLREKKVIVAFSGGVDSSLLAYLSNKHAKSTLLLTVTSVLNSTEEIEDAKKFAMNYNINQREMIVNPLENEKFIKNPKNKCYICKKELFSKYVEIKQDEHYDLIIDGSNADDIKDFRPGIEALKELNIESPYINFNINKQDIRELSQHFNLETSSKPSGACLASRIPYNQEITSLKLQMIDKAEKFLKRQFDLKTIRVRFHEDRLARIELPSDMIAKVLKPKNSNLIRDKLKELGFIYITVDIEGFRSGSLNESFN